jgi:hypothetical protein
MVHITVGVSEIRKGPRTQVKRDSRTNARKQDLGDRESLQVCSRLKSYEFLYTCRQAPFYRETKGLLHSEITLESMEYSKREHIHECPLQPVICGTNFQ